MLIIAAGHGAAARHVRNAGGLHACAAQSRRVHGVAVLVVAAFTGWGLDVIRDLFTWIRQVGTLGVLAGMTLASRAVIRFVPTFVAQGPALTTRLRPALAGRDPAVTDHASSGNPAGRSAPPGFSCRRQNQRPTAIRRVATLVALLIAA